MDKVSKTTGGGRAAHSKLGKNAKKNGNNAGGDDVSNSALQKTPEIEVSTKHSAQQVLEMRNLENYVRDILFLFVDHLGVFARTPSFPEVTTPVLVHLKKHMKSAKSEMLRKHMKNLVTLVDTTAGEVRALREGRTLKDFLNQYLAFETNKVALGRHRDAQLKLRTQEERNRVEAEINAAVRKDELDDGGEKEDEDREQQQDSEEDVGEEEDDMEEEDDLEEEGEMQEEQPAKRQKMDAKKPSAKIQASTHDVVEEFGLSDSEEQEDSEDEAEE